MKSMLRAEDISKSCLGDVLRAAEYILNNVTPESLPNDSTPSERWHQSKPDLKNLRIFGFKCCYKRPSNKIKKLEDRLTPSVFRGYSSQHSGESFLIPLLRKLPLAQMYTSMKKIDYLSL